MEYSLQTKTFVVFQTTTHFLHNSRQRVMFLVRFVHYFFYRDASLNLGGAALCWLELRCILGDWKSDVLGEFSRIILIHINVNVLTVYSIPYSTLNSSPKNIYHFLKPPTVIFGRGIQYVIKKKWTQQNLSFEKIRVNISKNNKKMGQQV